MLHAFSKSILQLTDPKIKRILLLSLFISIAVFCAVWMIIGYFLINITIFQIAWLETFVDTLGGIATFIITWVFFPGILSAIISLFLEEIATNIEKKHYPTLPPPAGMSFLNSLFAGLKFLLVFILVNLLLIPFLFFLPFLFPIIFLFANGYLLSREYFENVACRRLSPHDAKMLSKTHRNKLLIIGAIVSGLLTIPVINLIIPIVATSVMVHMFEKWRHL